MTDDAALREEIEREMLEHNAGYYCGQHEQLCYHQKPNDGCSMRDPRCALATGGEGR